LENTSEAENLQRKPLKEEIFDVLHKRIIAGKYPPGEWLRQEDIAGQLGVSMTPVREALDLLVSAGFAERVPYRGVRVLQLTPEEIVDSYAMRLLLETTAVRAAAACIGREQVEALARTVDRMQDLVTLNDMSSLQQLNRTFHIDLVAAGGNAMMTRLYEMVSNAFPDWMLYEAMFRHPELLESSLAEEYEEHRAIVAALARGDAGTAVHAVTRHLTRLGAELQEFLGVPPALVKEKEGQILPLIT
jgi:DNA-binding GntR family transcriptional regulator